MNRRGAAITGGIARAMSGQGLAAHCGQPYEMWKASLIDTFLLSSIDHRSDVIEIAPGHGRWTAEMVDVARTLVLVDLSSKCIDFCKERFEERPNLSYFVNDGRTLPVDDSSADFIWSFDSFVHIEADVIDDYLGEFARVLRPGGRFVIHHANKNNWSLRLVPMTSSLGVAGPVIQRVASQGRLRDSGNRSNVSAQMFASLAVGHGLEIELQTDRWGDESQYTVAKYHDSITVGSRPAP